MIDLGVALVWIVISAVSVVGLSAYARATAVSADAELASFAFDGQHDSQDSYAAGVYPMLPALSVSGLASAAAGDVGAASL